MFVLQIINIFYFPGPAMSVQAAGRPGEERHDPVDVFCHQHQAHHDQHRGEGAQEHLHRVTCRHIIQTKSCSREQGQFSF